MGASGFGMIDLNLFSGLAPLDPLRRFDISAAKR